MLGFKLFKVSDSRAHVLSHCVILEAFCPLRSTLSSVWTHLGHTEVSGGSRGISLLLGTEGGQLVLSLAALQLGQGTSATGTWKGE